MRQQPTFNVPPNEVGNLVQRYVRDGAKRIEAVQNTQGNWDITAYF
ncbi:MAG: hypothetical protein PHS51_14040 [Gallionella sp.]|nr:hypothetical protein [Gallionella sp.]